MMWKRKKKYVWVTEMGSLGGEGGVVAVDEKLSLARVGVYRAMGKKEYYEKKNNIWYCGNDYIYVLKWEVH